MNFASWNVRGLNKSPHQKEVKNLIICNKLSFISCLETRVKVDNALCISKEICKNWSWLFNYEDHHNGRIWVGWDPTVWKISLLSKSAQQISCLATFLEKQTTICVTFVYAFNTAAQRLSLWNELESISSTQLPWCVAGDFNCVSHINEISGGREIWTSAMNDFNNCIVNAGLGTLRTSGDLFTWSNNCPARLIRKRLDRMLINKAWLNSFSESYVMVLARGLMDHNPLILNSPMLLEKITKPFQYFSFMNNIEGFQDTVRNAWNCSWFGNPMSILAVKLKAVKKALIELNKANGNLQNNVSKSRSDLAAIQELLLANPQDSELLSQEKTAVWKLNKALMEEECFLRQKSRVKWLDKGDKNNKFFFSKIKTNWNRNKILSVADHNGEMVFGQKQVAKVAVDFFQNLLGNSNPGLGQIELEDSFNKINCKTLNPELCDALQAPVNKDLIFKTLKSMKKNAAPGPDGFSADFFISTWNIVGDVFCEAISHFFSTGVMHQGINSTSIALIPKVLNPTCMNDYRPISLCSTAYKCITKIIAGRLQEVLPNLINVSQSAFIKGRKISDNILMAQELIQGL